MRRFLIALIIFLCALPFSAHAQFYVCPASPGPVCSNGVNGNDANAGTFAAPFATPQHAQTAMQGSGTKKTIIEAGTYSLAANWTFSSSDNGESFVAYPGATVIISGGGSPASTNKVITTSSASNLTFKGLTFQNLGTAAGNNGSVFFTGGSNLTLQYNTFNNCEDFCIAFNGVATALVDSNHFNVVINNTVDTGSAVTMFNSHSNITISHNFCEMTGYACADQGVGVGAGTATNIVYDSNVSVNACANGIGGSPDGITDCGAYYMMDRNFTASGMKIINNVSFHIGHGDANQATKCIYLDDDISGVTVSGNLCYDVGTWGVQYHGGNNNHLTNNVFVLTPNALNGNQQVGFYQTQPSFSGTTMSGNTFQNNVVRYTNGSINGQVWQQSGTPANFPAISGNLYYVATGASYPNSTTNFIDSSPIYCGPSSGAAPFGFNPTQLWSAIASGAVSGWQQIALNQGMTFRSCAAGQF